MALFDDDFQGYTIGTVFPQGGWVNDPTAFTREIKAGPSTVAGTDRYLEIFLGGLAPDYTTIGYHSSFSLYTSLKLLSELPFGGSSFGFTNGPNAGGFSFTLFTIKVENDSTITVYAGGGQVLGNSGDRLFNFYAWNFLQIDCQLTDVTVLGVDYVHINLQLYLNGVQAISFSTTTNIAVAGLKNATSEVNHFTLLGGHWGAYTLDTYAGGLTYPHPGSPDAVIYQAPIEVDELPDDAELTVTQAAIEVDELPDTAELTITQAVIEVDLRERNRWYISES